MQKRNNVILYHAECLDGFGGAWVAWKKFGARAKYYPIRPRVLTDVPVQIKNATIYCIDNSLTQQDMRALRRKGNTIIVLDHHASSKEDIQHADAYRFDIQHSGAMLAWKYFFADKKVPRLVQYIEDGDLWRFKYKETNPIRSVLRTRATSFKAWDIFARDLEQKQTREKILQIGETLELYRNMLVEESLPHAQLVRFGDHVVYAINETTEAIRSEVASVLYKKCPPFSISWSLEKDGYHISLRSDGTYDVSTVAKKYGGGGHAVASGFFLPMRSKFPWRPVNAKRLKK